MSGARRMQELEYFRSGAALVISLDGLKWLSTRRCSDKGNKKRDEELQFWISPGQMILSDEKQQPITCFCILDQRGSAALNLWRNSDRGSSLESPTVELRSEPHPSLPSSNLPDVTLEDSGLEWEDDFAALENCLFQCVSDSQHYSLSLPTHSWAARSRPERYCLSQTCLFLTHVTESDLEL